MKQLFILIFFSIFALDVFAQLRPSESQYFVEKGVLINPSFEQGYQGWVITGCAKSLVSETPYLNKSLKLTCTNETFSIKQVSTALTSFSKQQGAFDLQIKTTASGVNVSSITNGVRDNVYSVINSTEFKRFKEIGFIVGDTDNGIEVYSDTNFTGEIVLDNVKLGLGNLTQDIGGAHFVGKLDLSNNCQYITTSASNSKLLDADTCQPTATIGDVSQPTNPLEAGIKIPNFRTDGYYRIETNGLHYTNAAGVCYFALSKTLALEGHGEAYINGNANSNSSVSADVKFETGDTGEVFVISRTFGSSSCILYGNTENSLAISAHFFPDSKNTIVSQDTELTAKTANELTARISMTTDTVTSENYAGWIDSIANPAVGELTVNVAGLGLSERLSCTCLGFQGGANAPTSCSDDLSKVSTNTVKYFSVTQGSAGVDGANIEIHCSKQGADVNKSQTIVGSFENLGDAKANTLNLSSIPTYADDAAAGAAGLLIGDIYLTATGELRIKL